jgi:peptidoglycan/xylan/chitin deacetylase (PgdA/CDA1 family)
MMARPLSDVPQIFSRVATAVGKGDRDEVLSSGAVINRPHASPARLSSRRIGETRKQRIHLTFDDGPDPINTPQLLDELRQAGILATFFVMGEKLETSIGQELIERAAREGHQIGNHTYSHPHLTDLTESQIRTEISKTEQLIGNADRGVKIFRPPYGEHNPLVDRVTKELGYRLVLWNVDSRDWDPSYQDRWVDHAMQQIVTQRKSIVLTHDSQITTVAKVGTLIGNIRELSDSRFIRYSEAFPRIRSLLKLSYLRKFLPSRDGFEPTGNGLRK